MLWVCKKQRYTQSPRDWSRDTHCILIACGADAKHEASQWLGAAAPFVGMVVVFQNDGEVFSTPLEIDSHILKFTQY